MRNKITKSIKLPTAESRKEFTETICKYLNATDSKEKDSILEELDLINGSGFVYFYTILNGSLLRYVGIETLIQKDNYIKIDKDYGYYNQDYIKLYARYDKETNMWVPANGKERYKVSLFEKTITSNKLWLTEDNPSEALNIILKHKELYINQKQKELEGAVKEYNKLMEEQKNY